MEPLNDTEKPEDKNIRAMCRARKQHACKSDLRSILRCFARRHLKTKYRLIGISIRAHSFTVEVAINYASVIETVNFLSLFKTSSNG